MNIHSGLNSKPPFKFKITYPQRPHISTFEFKNNLWFSKYFKFNYLVLNLFIHKFYLTFIINNIQIIKLRNPSPIFLNSKL